MWTGKDFAVTAGIVGALYVVIRVASWVDEEPQRAHGPNYGSAACKALVQEKLDLLDTQSSEDLRISERDRVADERRTGPEASVQEQVAENNAEAKKKIAEAQREARHDNELTMMNKRIDDAGCW